MSLLRTVSRFTRRNYARSMSNTAFTRLEVETTKAGDGASFPKAGDNLQMHYT